MPTCAAVWHLLQVAGTGGLSMPVWHVVHVVTPSWLTLAEAILPSWQVVHCARGIAFLPW